MFAFIIPGLLLAPAILLSLVLPAQAQEELEYRWKQIQGPNVIGHIKPVGVGMAGNGKWITSRAYLNGNRSDFRSGNGVEKQPDVPWGADFRASLNEHRRAFDLPAYRNGVLDNTRIFGDAESVKTANDKHFFYSRNAEIDNSGTIYSVFIGGITRKTPGASSIEPFLGTAHLTGDAAFLEALTADMGVNDDGVIWRIGWGEVDPEHGEIVSPEHDSRGGWRLQRYTDDGRWERTSGWGLRVDVDPDGNPWVVNNLGHIWYWDGSTWHRIGGEASDIAVGSEGTVWMVQKETGKVARLRAWQKGSTEALWEIYSDFPDDFEAVYIAAGASGQAIVSDNKGRLWRAVIDFRKPTADIETATTAIQVDNMRDIAATGPVTERTTKRTRQNLRMDDGGAISTWFLVGNAAAAGLDAPLVIDEATRKMLQGELGDIDLEAELNVTVGAAEDGCLISNWDGQRSQFSICLSADYANLSLQIGRELVSVPVGDVAGKLQHLVLALAHEGEDKELTARLWLNGTAYGPWFMDGAVSPNEELRIDLIVGALAPGQKVFGGRIGTTRIWADSPDPELISKAPFVDQIDHPSLPGYRDLVAEAAMTPSDGTIHMTDPSYLPARMWSRMGVDTFKPVPRENTKQQEGGGNSLTKALDVVADFEMPDIFRFRINESVSVGLPPTLTIFKDGEEGISETNFVQTGRNTYRGLVSPVAGEQGPFEIEIETAAVQQAFNGRTREIETRSVRIGSERLYEVSPYPEFGLNQQEFGTKLSERLARMKVNGSSEAKVAVSDSFAFENMA